MQETVQIALTLLHHRKQSIPTAAEIRKVALTVVVYQEIKQGRSIAGHELAKELAAIYGLDQEFANE